MIINNKQNEAQIVGDIQMNRVGIDSSNIDFIATLLTSNLYSNPFGSFLRETVSNAYDSHVEAKTKEPILLLIEPGAPNKIKVSIRDYGTGISPERFDKIYKNIGSSTKRESNDFIGMFGIGRFSVLSCANVANITSYYNGVKYSYLMYKNNGGINIDKLDEERGNFKNGLEVSAEINELSTSIFQDCLYMLAMFRNLHVECNVSRLSYICKGFNERKVVRKGNLLICNILKNNSFYKVGNVLYPARQRGGIITSGIIVELPMGQVDITPNREELQYSQFTNDTIDKACNSVQEIFKDMIQERIKIASIQDYYEFTQSYYFNVVIDDMQLAIAKRDYETKDYDITIEGHIVPKGFARFLDEIDYIYADQECIYKILSTRRRFKNSISLRGILSGGEEYAVKSDAITKQVTLQYYRENSKKDVVVFTQTGLDTFRNRIRTQLNLRPRVYDIDECMDFLFNCIPVKQISNSDIPNSFIEEYKNRFKVNRTVTQDTLFSIRKYGEDGYRVYDYNNFSFFIKYVTPAFIVYDNNTKEHETLKNIAKIFNYYKIQKNNGYEIPSVMTVKKTDIDLLKNRKKFVYINDFLYLRNNFLEKLVTAYLIMNRFRNISNYYLLRCKRYVEFKNKYRRQMSALSGCYGNETFENIVEYYTKKGWYNKVDMDYYKISDKDVEIIHEIELMNQQKEDVIESLFYRLYGNNKQLGITKPTNKNIYQIIKRL